VSDVAAASERPSRSAAQRSVQRAWFPVACALLLLLGGVYAYYQLFTGFAGHDDEGYLLVSLQSFVDGNALYSDVYSQYGPFYYELFGALFAVTGRPVTGDAGRFLVIAQWLAAASLLAWAVHAFARDRLLTLVALAASLLALWLLWAEPMHPLGIITVLLALMLAIATAGARWRPGIDAVALGCCCAALAMTKVNVGGLACVAIVAALLLAHVRRAEMRRWSWAALLVLLGLVPLLLVSGDLDRAWVRRMLVIVWVGSACIAIAALRFDAGAAERAGMRPWAWLARFLGAGIASGVVIAAIAVGLGTSVGDLIAGVVTDPMKLRDIFMLPLELPAAVVDWSLAVLVAAIAWSFAPHARTPRAVTAVVRIVAGLVVLLSLTHSAPVTLQPSSGPFALPALLAWIVVLPPAGSDVPGARDRFTRLVLALLPVLGVLQAYPVAGTQMYVAALLFLPAGCALLWDGARELRVVTAGRPVDQLRWMATVGTVAGVALLAKFVAPLAEGVDSGARAYANTPSLGLNGSQRLHLPQQRADALRGLATTMKAECDAVVMRPGLNSFYIWSEMEPPTAFNATDWMYLLDAEQQQRIVDTVRGADRLCLLQNEDRYNGWVVSSPQGGPPDRPLLRFIGDVRWTEIAAADDGSAGGRYRLLRR
jgi:hypothetical protein